MSRDGIVTARDRSTGNFLNKRLSSIRHGVQGLGSVEY